MGRSENNKKMHHVTNSANVKDMVTFLSISLYYKNFYTDNVFAGCVCFALYCNIGILKVGRLRNFAVL